ncbi:MAG: hypothetical protein AB1714_10595 [Acidobacteriota bacterium]
MVPAFAPCRATSPCADAGAGSGVRHSSKKGKPCTPASIYGTNFSPAAASNIVYFGKLKVTPKKASASRLDVNIPAKCRSGRTYKVKVVSGSVTSNVVQFKVR